MDDLSKTEDDLSKCINMIERTEQIIESHIIQLADWIKLKYRLEDHLKKLRTTKQEEPK